IVGRVGELRQPDDGQHQQKQHRENDVTHLHIECHSVSSCQASKQSIIASLPCHPKLVCGAVFYTPPSQPLSTGRGRAGERRNRCSDKHMLNLMAVGRTSSRALLSENV